MRAAFKILPAYGNMRIRENPYSDIFYSMHVPIAQKMKFSIKDLFSKCDQIRRFLLLKKSLMENFIFCGVWIRGRFWWLTNLPIKLAECMCITTSFNIISKGKLISRSIHASSLSVKWWPHAANRTRLNGDLFNNKTSGLGLVDGPVILA